MKNEHLKHKIIAISTILSITIPVLIGLLSRIFDFIFKHSNLLIYILSPLGLVFSVGSLWQAVILFKLKKTKILAIIIIIFWGLLLIPTFPASVIFPIKTFVLIGLSATSILGGIILLRQNKKSFNFIKE